jgi:TolA-binding protein
VRENEKTSQEDKFKTGVYAGKAYLLKGDTASAVKEFNYTLANTKTIAAAEAKYNLADIDYAKHRYKTSQKQCFELVKDMPNYDYWVAKTYILLADDYIGLKDAFQAKATLQSIIDNYKGDDDILPAAKQKLDALTGKTEPVAAPDSTQNMKTDTSKTGGKQ